MESIKRSHDEISAENKVEDKAINKVDVIESENKKQKVGEEYICPLSKKIFLNPVVASDGNIYEKQEIKKWKIYNNKSPLNPEIILNDTFLIVRTIKNEITEMINKTPELRLQQYMILKKDYTLYKQEVIRLLSSKLNGYHILKYNKFILNDFVINMHSLIELAHTAYKKNYINLDIMQYIIINSIDRDSTLTKGEGIRIIHYFCLNKEIEIIKYLIENKLVDYECEDLNKDRPIHYICKYCGPDMIKYMVDNTTVDLYCKNDKGVTPINMIFNLADIGTINKSMDNHYRIDLDDDRINFSDLILCIVYNDKLDDIDKLELIKNIALEHNKYNNIFKSISDYENIIAVYSMGTKEIIDKIFKNDLIDFIREHDYDIKNNYTSYVTNLKSIELINANKKLTFEEKYAVTRIDLKIRKQIMNIIKDHEHDNTNNIEEKMI